jgi:hypothetical protein
MTMKELEVLAEGVNALMTRTVWKGNVDEN